ncbi:MAG: oligosaccharide flippase family protein [Candidatus Micrarchaeota archaeon]|nr:oligosaccharide flippase family protein [Candidatus Micrarchaeota archaeon]
MEDDNAAKHSHEVAWGSFWGLVGTLLLKLVSFAYAIYVARAFSQENVGLFYLALSVIGVVGFWRDLGLPAALQRYIPFYEAKKQGGKALSLLKISFAVELVLGAALSAALFIYADPIGAFYQNAALAEGLRLLAAYVVFENLSKVPASYLQGRGDIKSCQFLSNVQNITKLAFTLLLFSFYGATLFTLSAAFALSFLAALLLSVPILLRSMEGHDFKEGGPLSNSELMHDILPFGITLTIVGSFWALISSTDRMLLGYFGNPATSIETVAIYSIATQLALTIMVFPSAFGSIFLPVISRLAGKDDHATMRKVVQTSQRWILFITIPIALATMAFAGEMLSVFYGSPYRSGGNAMAIFILGLMFSTIIYPITLALAGMRLVRLELNVAIVVGIANVILNILLIPGFGMEGAAFASAAAFLLSALMFERYGRQYLDYKTPLEIYKLFIAGAVAFAAIMLLKPSAALLASGIPAIGTGEIALYAYKFSYLALLGIMGCVGLALFGVVALLLRTFKREDIDLLYSAAGKAHLPQGAISIAEKIASYGVED